MAKPRILYITEEIYPYLPETPNSLLGRELPRLSQDDGYEVRIFMPRFGTVNERRNQLHEVIRLSGINIPIDDADHPLIIKVASMHPSRIQVYFIDNDDYFQRLDSDVDPIGSNRPDNDERAIFFTRGTMETVRKLRWEASVVHCMGWMSALAPIFIRRLFRTDPAFRGAHIVFTVLPGQAPPELDPRMVEKLRAEGLKAADLTDLAENPSDARALYRLAIRSSDAVIIADPAADDLAEFAAALGKKVMKAPENADPRIFVDFYNSLNEK